jgi:hypothetical protein
LPNAAPEGTPVASPGRPHVADDDGGGAEPAPLPDARLDNLPVSRRGADVDALMGGEALVPGCAGIPGEANAGDRVTGNNRVEHSTKQGAL